MQSRITMHPRQHEEGPGIMATRPRSGRYFDLILLGH